MKLYQVKKKILVRWKRAKYLRRRGREQTSDLGSTSDDDSSIMTRDDSVEKREAEQLDGLEDNSRLQRRRRSEAPGDQLGMDSGYFQIVFLGGPRVGKTSIITNFLDSEADWKDKYHETQCDEVRSKTYRMNDSQSITLKFIDVAGNLEFPTMRKLAISAAAAIVLVCSGVEQNSWEVAKSLWEEVKLIRSAQEEDKNNMDRDGTFVKRHKLQAVLILNKADMALEKWNLDEKEIASWSALENIPVITTSAKHNLGIDIAFKTILLQSKHPRLRRIKCAVKQKSGEQLNELRGYVVDRYKFKRKSLASDGKNRKDNSMNTSEDITTYETWRKSDNDKKNDRKDSGLPYSDVENCDNISINNTSENSKQPSISLSNRKESLDKANSRKSKNKNQHKLSRAYSPPIGMRKNLSSNSSLKERFPSADSPTTSSIFSIGEMCDLISDDVANEGDDERDSKTTWITSKSSLSDTDTDSESDPNIRNSITGTTDTYFRTLIEMNRPRSGSLDSKLANNKSSVPRLFTAEHPSPFQSGPGGGATASKYNKATLKLPTIPSEEDSSTDERIMKESVRLAGEIRKCSLQAVPLSNDVTITGTSGAGLESGGRTRRAYTTTFIKKPTTSNYFNISNRSIDNTDNGSKISHQSQSPKSLKHSLKTMIIRRKSEWTTQNLTQEQRRRVSIAAEMKKIWRPDECAMS